MIRRANNLLLAGGREKEAEKTLSVAVLALRVAAGELHPLTARLSKKHKQISEENEKSSP